MAADSLKVGIIGTSWWADSMYMPALDAHPNAVVTACCGRNQERAEAFAKTWSIEQVFTDYEEMLASGVCDAVVIATTNDTHYPMTMAALDQGLHVLCEKPLALNAELAAEMTAKAEEAGVTTMVPFTYRFMPTARYVKDLIEDGYIGTPYHLNLRYYTGFARDSEYAWRFNTDTAGSGILGDIGSHFIYLAHHYFGEIVAVNAQLKAMISRPHPDGIEYTQAEDTAMVMLEFANGAQGVVHASALCYEDSAFGQTHQMEFHGSGGTLTHFMDWDTVQRVSGAKEGEGLWKELEIPASYFEGVRTDTVHNTYKDTFRAQDHMTRAWVNDAIAGRQSSPDFAEGAYIQRVLDACVKSNELRAQVRV